jgi:hypothetical protein
MGKSDVKTREDEMWCPECGAPIKKGFFTCSNCRFKVRMTNDINKKQAKKKASGSKKKQDPEDVPVKQDIPVQSQDKPAEKNPLKKSGHPRYWSF